MHRPRRRGARPPLLALLAALLLAARGATAQVKTVIFSYFLYSDDGSVRAYLTVQQTYLYLNHLMQLLADYGRLGKDSTFTTINIDLLKYDVGLEQR
ncbi:hypothetical protein JEQ12_000416 [Ovis aries]|uniref:Uncharacterized protein n=1 Tax=Ovis aries TaxID=9940 RepID=A0A836AFH7_SHEEP|nr:hypothetical protein JEQ12_000416 [Ovis aries]